MMYLGLLLFFSRPEKSHTCKAEKHVIRVRSQNLELHVDLSHLGAFLVRNKISDFDNAQTGRQ